MEILIWSGAAVALAGVATLIWCVVLAIRARKSGLTDDAQRAALQKVVVLNMGALGISALGLIMVVVGILLG
tara:strand:- start:7145 stop:7360 length:216 start_codon:yes stop_codon:yes gene_type:complete